MNLATNVEWSAFFFPKRPVVSEGSSETSYAQFNEKWCCYATDPELLETALEKMEAFLGRL